MQYEHPENKERKNASSKYAVIAYNLPYLESRAIPAGDDAQADPYMQIFVSQIRNLTIYSNSVTEYRVKLRRENRR